MKVIRFNNKEHMSIITHWLTERGAYVPDASEMPGIGYIVYTGGIPTSAGFLRLVEGGFAQVDSIVTNPKVRGEFRHRANDALFTKLIEKAKELELKGIVGQSVDKGTLMRAEKHGFTASAHVMMSLPLSTYTKENK